MKILKCIDSKFTLPLGDLRPNPKNPKVHTKEQLAHLKKSFIEFGFSDPIATWGDNNIIVEGHGRYLALRELTEKDGWQLPDGQVPIIRLDHLTPTQRDAYMIEHNQATLETDYDSDLLESPLKDLTDDGMDMTEFGFGQAETEELDDLLDEKYSASKGEVTYEPKETHHEVSDLYKAESKFDADIDQIEDEEMRRFLRLRAAWFTKFDFAKIADYYAYQATEQEQQIFEKLGLVLMDEDKLYANGYAELMRQVDGEDEPNDDEDGGDGDD